MTLTELLSQFHMTGIFGPYCNPHFAFEENGAIRQYEGGYTDYVKKRPASTENSFDGKTKSHTGNKEARMVYKNREKKLKFSYQEQREYETIEEDISVLETTIETLDQEMAENGTDYVKLRELSEKKMKQRNS